MDDDFDDSNEEALYNQWMNFSSSGQWDRAKEVLGQLLIKEPESTHLHCKMGTACYQLDQNKESEKHFQKAIALTPDDSEPFQGLTYLYISMNRAGPAEDHCRKALQLDPDDINNWVLMAHLSIHFEDLKEATKSLEKAAALNPHDSRLIFLRTQLGAITTGESKLSPDEQIGNYRDILAQDPENHDAHYRIGVVQLYETNDLVAAEHSFRAALQLSPQDLGYQRALITVLRKNDLILKTLWSPLNFGLKIMRFFGKAWEKKWRLFVLLLTWKFVIIGGALLWLIFLIFFWPMTKVYEILTLVEVHKKMGKISIYTGPLSWLHRLSFPVRCVLCGAIFASFWSGLIWLWQGQEARSMIVDLGLLGTLTVILITILVGLVNAGHDSYRNRKRRKKNSKIH